MTRAEKIELGSIPIAGAAIWLLAPVLTDRLGIGRVFVFAAGLLLLQGLVRDVCLLAVARRQASAPTARREARCMCVESALGVTGLVAGTILLGAGFGAQFPMTRTGWCLGGILVLGLGFLLKDLVFEWNPWRIRREKDHLNIVFTWKR